jgi:hypothetical protein
MKGMTAMKRTPLLAIALAGAFALSTSGAYAQEDDKKDEKKPEVVSQSDEKEETKKPELIGQSDEKDEAKKPELIG